jgi:hypothetical protein
VTRELSVLIAQAKKRADTRTWFQKSQASVKQLYDSPIYLTTISVLLIVVMHLPHTLTRALMQYARPPADPFARGRLSCSRA